jgi:hypothetical protein
MKIELVTDAQHMKQCVYYPMCLWHILHNETSRLLEVHIKGHKYNLTRGLLEKSKLAQHGVRRRSQNTLERSKGLADWTKHHLQEMQGICSYVCGRSSD